MIWALRPEPEASAELEDAALWYERQRLGLGQEFLGAVDETLKRIARWPQIGGRVPDLADDVPARKAPVDRFPYHIVYFEWEGIIRILAFAHDRREPGYWLSRMNK